MSHQPQASTTTSLIPASDPSNHPPLDSVEADSIRRPPRQRLLHSIARPLHCGIDGSFAADWLRTAFAEALIEDERLPDVVTTHHDLALILRGHRADGTNGAFDGRLSVFDTLEDSIEHLEAKADRVRAGLPVPTTIWVTTLGDNTDVIHQTIDYWAGLDLIALLRGHWPHGPNRRPHPAHWPTTITHAFSAQPLQDALAALQPPS
ncbi:hypothetical protein [Actinomadura harenae]|uniref:Uncharacterized protein n=1 Tax=Actinomadura harenae TaxID=2483351 RepID=A0A3M2M506_9ACTN|nr:hypothetical protein [Actinomadura harenae]RMI43903.1 hypothetical protein EBO15_14465 [Actinomadura harenae]